MTTALSFRSSSDQMSFLLALEMETKDPKKIITSIERKIFKEGETQVTVTLGKKSVLVTKEKIPEFIKSLITKSTKSLENQKDLFEVLSKTFALRPILEKKAYCSLINSQFEKLSKMLDTSIEQEKEALSSPTLDNEAREKALSPIFEQGTEMLDLLGNLRIDFAGDQETSRILFSFFSQITKKITALVDFLSTGSAIELQTALAPLRFSVELIEKEEDPQKVRDQLQKIVEPLETERISKIAANATTPVQQTTAKTHGVFLRALRGVLLLATAGVALFQNKIPVSEGGLASPPGLEKQIIGSALLWGLSDLLSLFPVTERVLAKLGTPVLHKVISAALSLYGGAPLAKVATTFALSELLKKAARLTVYHVVGKKLPSYQQEFLSSAGNFVLSYATGYCAKRVVNEAFSAGSKIFTHQSTELPPQIGQAALSVLGSAGILSFAAASRGELPILSEKVPINSLHTFEDMTASLDEMIKQGLEKMDPAYRSAMETFLDEPFEEINVEEAAGEFFLTQALLEEQAQAERTKASLLELQTKIPQKVAQARKEAVTLGKEIQKFIAKNTDPEFEKRKKTLIDESWATYCWAHTLCESTNTILLGLLERAKKTAQAADKKALEAERFAAQIEEQKKTAGVNIPHAEELSSFLAACKEQALQAKAVEMMSTNRLSMMPYIRIGGVVEEFMNISWEDPPTEKFIQETRTVFVRNIGFMYTKPVIAHDKKICGIIQEQLCLLQKTRSSEEALRLLRSLHKLVTKTLFDEFVSLMYHPLPMDDDTKLLNEMKQRAELLQKTKSTEEAKRLRESIEMLRLVMSERLDLYKEIIDQSEHLNKAQALVEHKQQVFYQNGISTYKYACSRWEASLQKAYEYENLAALDSLPSQKSVSPSKLFDPTIQNIESLLTSAQETDPQKKRDGAYLSLAESTFDELQRAKKGNIQPLEYKALVDKTLATLDSVFTHLSQVYDNTGKGIVQAKKLMTSTVSTLEPGSAECLKAHELMEKTLLLSKEQASLFERLQKVRELRAAAKA